MVFYSKPFPRGDSKSIHLNMINKYNVICRKKSGEMISVGRTAEFFWLKPSNSNLKNEVILNRYDEKIYLKRRKRKMKCQNKANFQ